MTISRFRTLASAFLIFNFAFLIAHAAAIPGTVILNKITLGDDSITNKAIGDTVEMKGTPKQVANTAARDAIPAVRRTEGMECWVVDIASSYRLIGGILNANWTVITNGSGTDASSLITGIVPDGRLPATNRTYSSIAVMIADTAPKGTVAHVASYYGTNDVNGAAWGGGDFIRIASDPGTTNLGTLFFTTNAAGSGYWKRIVESQNVFRLEWFGVWPITANTTIHSSRREFTNCLEMARLVQPATIILPYMTMAVDTAPGQTNAILIEGFTGLTIKGEGQAGVPLSLGLDAPVIGYIGVTNGIMVNIFNSSYVDIDGIGFLTTTPSLNHSIVTNQALVAIEMDQDDDIPHVSITTKNTIQNVRIQSGNSGNTAHTTGIYISRISPDNCEAITLRNLQIQMGGNANHALNGTAIHLGGSANMLGLVLDEIGTSYCSTNIFAENGGYVIRGGLSTDPVVAYQTSGSDPIRVSGTRSEHAWRFLDGAGTGVQVDNNFIPTDSAASRSGTNSTVRLHDGHYFFFNNQWQDDPTYTTKHFDVAPGATAITTFINNKFGLEATNSLPTISAGFAVGNIGQPGDSIILAWTRGEERRLFSTFNPVDNSLVHLISLGEAALPRTMRLSPYDGKVIIGPGTQNDNFQVRSADTTTFVDFGDSVLDRRFRFYSPSAATSVVEIRSTNRAILAIDASVSPGTGGLLQFDVSPTENILDFSVNAFKLRGVAGRVFAQFDVNSGLEQLTATNTMTLKAPTVVVTNLAGSGTRMVVANDSGSLSTQAIPSGGGDATNAILMLDGFGTNTYLRGVTIAGVQTNNSLVVSGSITRTNYTTGVRSVESAAGHLFYPSNSVVPTVNINGVTGDVTATQFIGAGGGLTYTGSGNNGNLATSVDTVQELNDAVDNLSLGAGGGATNAVTTVSTNGTALTTAATNLNFWQGTGITITGTNLGGLVGMRFDAGSALATDAEVAAAYIASNAGSGTNNSFTGSTNYGNSFRTNWTWMDSRGWHNTNNSAAGQGVDISAGAITANSFSAVTFNLGTLNLTNALGLAAGGTGSSLSDPGAHRLWGWDDTDGAIKWFTLGSGLSYDAGTDTISATASGTGDVTAAANFGADNSLVRSDGTSKGVQASGIVVTDTGALTNVDSISISNRIYNYLGGFILEWDTSSIQYFHQDGSGVMLEGFSDGTAVFKSGNTSASITLADDATITFVGDIRIPQSAAPTPNAIGEIAFDNDVYSGGQGALKIYDGTDVQVLVGVLATEVPTDGQRPTWHQAGITWDTGPSLTGTNAWTGSNYFIYATVADEVYDATAWNGSLAVPTKNAIRDKIESMAGGGGGSATNAVTTISSNNVAISTAATNLHFWAGANMTLGFTNSPSGDVDVGIAGTNIFTTVNALDFGLVAGGADQTAILQAAVNVAATSGKRVFIPAAPANGWYRLNGTVHLPTGVTLEGEFASGAQHQGTRFYAGDSAKTMVMIDGPGVAIRNIQFFDNNPATGTVAIQSSTNVPSSPATEVIIENCAFMGIGVGIKMNYAWHWDINNCYGEDVGTGIWASNAVNAININGGHWVGTQGIYLAGTENYGWNIESRFETCTRAVVITNWAYQVNIRGSYFEGNTASIVAGGNAGSTPLRGLAISDNVFVNTLSGTNITLLNAAGVIVQNNTFTGAGVGIAAASTVVDLKDLNNYYQNNSNWIAATVSVMKTDTNLTITGGQINGSGLGLTNVSGLRTTAGSATLAASGQVSVNTTSKMLGIHNGTKEVAIPLIEHREFSFDPKAVCDGAVDRLFLFKVGAWAPNGITITGWRVSFEADPTTEVDLDLKRADAFIGVANSAVMDVLDTTTGASSEATAANINSGAVVANGKVVYLEFGTAYTETTHQIIVELEYEVEED